MTDDASVRVDFHGTPEQLQRLAVFLSDLRSFWPLLVPAVTGWWRHQFETEGQFAGHAWQPLTPAYAAAKARTHPGRGILVATGALKRAASAPRRAQTATSLTLAIDDPKLPFHQEGTTKMPARPLIFGDPLPAAARAELDTIAHAYVTDLLKRL